MGLKENRVGLEDWLSALRMVEMVVEEAIGVLSHFWGEEVVARPIGQGQLARGEGRFRVGKHRFGSPGPLVVRSRLQQQRSGSYQLQNILHISQLEDARKAEFHLHAGVVGEGLLVIHASAVGYGGLNAVIDGRSPDGHSATVRVADESNPEGIDFGPGLEVIQGHAYIVKTLGKQRPALHQASGQLVILRVSPRIAPVALFEGQGIGRNHDISALGELDGIGLVRVARKTHDLALSQMKLAVVLMVGKDCGGGAIDVLRHQQERADALIGFDCVCDGLPEVRATIGRFQDHGVEWAGVGKRAKEMAQSLEIHGLHYPRRGWPAALRREFHETGSSPGRYRRYSKWKNRMSEFLR
jgi:hypothetical protein